MDGKQYASFTTSMNRAGSQKLTGMPTLANTGGGMGHTQTGEDAKSGASGASLGDVATVSPPILNGNIHCQHTSVMGLCGLHLQIAYTLKVEHKKQTAVINTILFTF